jgi:hypothetical protein
MGILTQFTGGAGQRARHPAPGRWWRGAGVALAGLILAGSSLPASAQPLNGCRLARTPRQWQ